MKDNIINIMNAEVNMLKSLQNELNVKNLNLENNFIFDEKLYSAILNILLDEGELTMDDLHPKKDEEPKNENPLFGENDFTKSEAYKFFTEQKVDVKIHIRMLKYFRMMPLIYNQLLEKNNREEVMVIMDNAINVFYMKLDGYLNERYNPQHPSKKLTVGKTDIFDEIRFVDYFARTMGGKYKNRFENSDVNSTLIIYAILLGIYSDIMMK